MGKKSDAEGAIVYNETGDKLVGKETDQQIRENVEIQSIKSEKSNKTKKSSPSNDVSSPKSKDFLHSDMKKKYKIILNSLSFNEDNKLESNIINRFDISPYELMCECCMNKDPNKKQRYQVINKCKSIIEKAMNIEYIIKKNMEVNFLKEYLFDQSERNVFKYHLRPLNIMNFDYTMEYLRKVKKEGEQDVTKDQLIDLAMKENKHLFEQFFDYHAN